MRRKRFLFWARDAFIFSTRLAFLDKVSPKGDVFLILDDPFIFMDRERQLCAIKATKHFFDRHQFPILFFTKDSEMQSTFCSVFSEAKVIELTK